MQRIRWHKLVVRNILYILISLAIGLFISFIFMGGYLFHSFGVFLRTSAYSLIIGIGLWKSNELYTLIVNKYFDKKCTPGRTLAIDLIGTIIISASVILIVNYFFIFLIAPNSTFNENPRLFILIGVIQLFISLLITSVFYVRNFFRRWRSLLVNEEKLKRDAIVLQYEALKSNISPHFLFNSLSVLDKLIEEDADKAQEFTRQLSNVYRYVLESKDKELVPLSEELNFAQSFIDLHSIRHEGGIEFILDVKQTEGLVVPMSLQILLENALKHNEFSSSSPLQISIVREGNFLAVENTHRPKRTVLGPSGIGLETLDSRYRHIGIDGVKTSKDDGVYRATIPVVSGI